jgi:hypothetical protein
MNEPRNDEQFAERAKTLFDNSVDKLDAAALSRLNKGRHAALEQLKQSPPRSPSIFWIPATGIATAALVALIVLRGPADVGMPLEAPVASDFEILLEADSLEMLEELEFYSWLELAELEVDNNVG